MKAKGQVCLVGLLFGIVFLIAPQGWAQPKPEAKGPAITHAFAIDKGYYGSIWKIYLEAEDPDGDMLSIVSTVDQAGFGHYPTNWIYLKPQYQKGFRGYIQWNTFSSKTPYLSESTRIELKVSVLDKAGNESNVIVFPFEFVSGVRGQYQVKLPAPFDQRDLPRLGYLSTDLVDLTQSGASG